MRPVDVAQEHSDLLVAQPFYYWSESTVADGPRGQDSVPGSDPFSSVRQDSSPSTDEDEENDSEMVQICNLNESVLRLEEMAQKKRMTFKLSMDGINGLNALYHELLELSSRTNHSLRHERSRRMAPCRVTAARGFCGLKSEDVDTLDERTLIQLVHEFGLEDIKELPVLQTEALSSYI